MNFKYFKIAIRITYQKLDNTLSSRKKNNQIILNVYKYSLNRAKKYLKTFIVFEKY